MLWEWLIERPLFVEGRSGRWWEKWYARESGRELREIVVVVVVGVMSG